MLSEQIISAVLYNYERSSFDRDSLMINLYLLNNQIKNII